MVSLNYSEWHRILYDHRISADKRLVADTAKLVHTRISSDTRFIGDLYMAGESCGVCHDDLAAELAIVCDVGLCHQQIFIADPRHSAAARRAAMDGYKFANMIA